MISFGFAAVPSSMESHTSTRLIAVKGMSVPRAEIELSALPNELELRRSCRKRGKICSAGLAHAYNRLLHEATREFVALVDDDVTRSGADCRCGSQ